MVNIHTGIHYELEDDIDGRTRLVRETADPVGYTPAQRTKIGDDIKWDNAVCHVSSEMVVTGVELEENLPKMLWKPNEHNPFGMAWKHYKDRDIPVVVGQQHGQDKFGRGRTKDPAEHPHQKFLGDGTPACRELQRCDIHPGDDDE